MAPVWDDVKTFDGRPWRGVVDIVTAGYPCQPFSTAGKKQGTKDPRHLWPDIERIIGEIRPRRVFLENVPHHLRIGFPVVGKGLRCMGYRFVAGLFSAREVGAAHFRRRLFVLADANGDAGLRSAGNRGVRGGLPVPERGRVVSNIGEDRSARLVAALGFDRSRGRRCGAGAGAAKLPIFAPGPGAIAAWHKILRADPGLKPALRRDADGMADRLDRNRLVGNGVCPLAAAHAYRSLSAELGMTS